MFNILTDLLAVAIVLGVLVLVHEWGHYFTAKLFGVRVETFSIGFGKRLFGWRRGDTDYRISILPLGGYVKMSGENPLEPSTGDPREFMSHPRWQRFLIALAGPAMNVILAIVVVTGIFMAHYEHPFFLDKPAVIMAVDDNSPAAKAGLQANDRIVRMDGTENPTWESVRDQMLISSGQPFQFEVQRGKDILPKQLTLNNTDAEPLDVLGITPQQPNRITELESGMPAEKAGLQLGDEVLAVNGIASHSTRNLFETIQQVKDKPVTVTVKRDGKLLNFSMTPQLTPDDAAGQKRYLIGVREDPVQISRLSLPAAFVKSLQMNKKFSVLIFEVMEKLVQHKVSIKQMSGPVGIAQQSGRAAREGWMPLLLLLAGISLNLAIFNLFPIPILDGGLILLLIIEGVMQRDIRREIKERVYQAAFVFLILFAVVVVYNDIAKTTMK